VTFFRRPVLPFPPFKLYNEGDLLSLERLFVQFWKDFNACDERPLSHLPRRGTAGFATPSYRY
jgi:hypothetical protein